MNEISTVIVFLVIIIFFALVILIIIESNELFIEYRNSKLQENKVKRDKLSKITDIKERVKAIRDSEQEKKFILQDLKQDKTLEQIEVELKAKLELLKSV